MQTLQLNAALNDYLKLVFEEQVLAKGCE